MIKINLAREGRAAVRGAGAGGGAGAPATEGGPSNRNNMMVLALLGLGVLSALGYWFLKSRELADRKAEVEVRRAEAQKLESIIKEVDEYKKRKDSLENRITLINKLKQNQKGPVRILDRISQDLPDLVWLDKMSLAGGQISVTGRALNPNAAGTFVENIRLDSLFEEPDFSGLTRQSVQKGAAVYTFGMSFNFKYGTGAPAEGSTPAGENAAPTTTSPAAAGSKS